MIVTHAFEKCISEHVGEERQNKEIVARQASYSVQKGNTSSNAIALRELKMITHFMILIIGIFILTISSSLLLLSL